MMLVGAGLNLSRIYRNDPQALMLIESRHIADLIFRVAGALTLEWLAGVAGYILQSAALRLVSLAMAMTHGFFILALMVSVRAVRKRLRSLDDD